VLAEVVQRHDSIYRGELVAISMSSRVINVTANHPFWVLSGKNLDGRPFPHKLASDEDVGQSLPGRWVDSHHLQAGDMVFGYDGTQRCIEHVSVKSETAVPVSNLTVREQHTFAVGDQFILVHNTAWCTILREKLEGKGPSRDLLNKQADLIQKTGKDYKIHAHHIVMKTVNSKWSKEAQFWVSESQRILDEFDIKLLGTQDELRIAGKDELQNMCWALNSADEIHGHAYAKAVYDKLSEAAASGSRRRVLSALKSMNDKLSVGEKFW
jgi:hypothetical protein